MSALARRACLLVLLVGWLMLPGRPAGAQEGITKEQRRKALFEGTHVFRRILHDEKLTPLERFDDLNDAPGKTILILLGDLDQLTRVPDGLDTFLARGGAALLASDRALSRNEARRQLADAAGVSISGERLVCQHLPSCYKRTEFCPFLLPVNGAEPELLPEPREPDLWTVATNLPSHLVPVQGGPRLRLLANLPSQCRYEEGGFLFLGRLPFIVGGDVAAGRLLVLADHSIFINEMMLPTDNNNVEFTENCVRWLKGGTKRNRVLFVDNGKIETKFDIPLKSINLPVEEMLRLLFDRRNELLAEAERGLTNLEDRNFFNDTVLGVLDRTGWPLERLIQVLAALGTVVLLCYGIYRLGIRGRFKHETEVPLLATVVGQSLPAAPLMEQRQHTLLQMGNLSEPASHLARRWCERQGLLGRSGEPGRADSAARLAAPAWPPIVVAGGWWRRRQLTRQLGRLWRLAWGQSPGRIEPAGLWRLQRELDQLDASRRRGEWRPRDEGSGA